MITRLVFSAALLFGTTSTLAGVDITKMTTVVDDFGGSYTTTTQLRAEDGTRNGTSVSEYNNFRASEERGGISGTISDVFERTREESTAVAEGALSLSGAEETLEISFEDLVVTRANGEILIEGEITADEITYTGEDLPDRLKRILGRLFLRLHR